MEALLHYIWKHRNYLPSQFQTTCGQTLEIIDPGIYNSDAGPDFFNAKIKIDGEIWAGNIEIHTCSSDWYKHKHHLDNAYNSVILHIVESVDKEEIITKSGRKIPQFILKIPDHIRMNYQYLLKQENPVPCLSRIREIPAIYWSDWKNTLTIERLERKTQTIFDLLDEYHDDWNEIFYITLARNFGFGINNDAFERLAKSLPFKYILKHCDSPQQIEALFLGQAGLLENDSFSDEYYRQLKNEYRFLSQKYNLKPLDASIFKSLRIRPNNFPHIKLVQLAGFITKGQTLFSQILEKNSLKEFQSLFVSEVNEYWENHYHFEKTSPRKKKSLSLSAIHILLINTVVPVLFAYGKRKNMEIFIQKALELLENIPPERNHIITYFEKYGVKSLHAADSQALIQLKRVYCEAKKCIYCRMGHRLLNKNIVSLQSD
ncbi:hypothetical protein FACS189413_00700 [Bacteroidia bacterium]|nr:hypothetical protein FACS189463_1390 [Bacteroidia bacterium]GHU66890.1 hypothetical protein FACS189413_00700 [Bacteroidia bacterium]